MKRLSAGQVESQLRLAGESYKAGDPAAALRTLEAILHSNPDSIEALSSAIQVSFELRQPTRTEFFARRLVRLQPENDRAYFTLSVALSLTGRWLDALEAIDKALVIQPLALDYVVGKAQLLVKLHLHSLAIEWYRKALDIRPVPQFAHELADVLMEESQLNEAISLLEQYALELPPEARPNVLLGRAYTESQRFDEAEQHWRSADRFSSDRASVLAARARSEISSGRIQVAEELLRDALAQEPSATQFFGMLAPITNLTSSDLPLVENMERLLSSGGFDAVTKQSLNYALGKSFHDLGDYEKAIAFYDEANRLRDEVTPNKLRFDRQKWKADIDFQIGFFTKERIDSLVENGAESEMPLFIVGMIRSGTTLTEQILSCHSKIRGAGENTFWFDHFGDILDSRSTRFDTATGRRLGKEYLQILEAYGSGARYVIDKNPLNVLLCGLLHCIYPNARMIHIMRHPVDTLLSIWTTPITTGLQFISTREDLVFAYRQYLRLAHHLQSVLPADRFNTISYELLTSSPVTTIESILRYLGLKSETACFAPEKNPRTVRTPSVYQVRQPINTDSQAKWKLYEPWLGPFAELLDQLPG